MYSEFPFTSFHHLCGYECIRHMCQSLSCNRCAVGTPVLAIDDGVVKEIQQQNVVSGIHVRNLFQWNSLMLQLDNGSFVEYVHIKVGNI